MDGTSMVEGKEGLISLWGFKEREKRKEKDKKHLPTAQF